MLNGKKACVEGIFDITIARNKKELAGLFWEYYRFCVARRFPSPEYIAKRIHEAKDEGIYANTKDVKLHNARQVALLGTTSARLSYDGGGCAHVIATDKAKAEITLEDGVALFLDVQRGAQVLINANGYSTLRIHSWGDGRNVKVNAAEGVDCKIINHEGETYDNV